MLWTTWRKRATAMEEAIEALRREVQGMQYDMLELKRRMQRVLWRERKAEGAGVAAGTDTSPEMRDGTASAALARATGEAPATDPVSAMLLARRRKAPLPPEET